MAGKRLFRARHRPAALSTTGGLFQQNVRTTLSIAAKFVKESVYLGTK
jgi:hypothetical protein